MSKTRKQKEETVASLKDKLSRMRSVIFANYEGLPVKDVEALRRELKAAGIDYTVAKKTLLGLAAKAAGMDLNPKEIEGNFAAAIECSKLGNIPVSFEELIEETKKFEKRF